MPTMTKEEQVLLGKLLTATACLLVRSNSTIRREVVAVLVRDHPDEVVTTFIEGKAA